MKVLGIDPGTLNLGWGFIETDSRGNCQYVDHGSFHVPAKLPLYGRLHSLSESLRELTERLKPDVAVIENIFLGKSVDSAFKLGHIRGICAAHCHGVGAEIVEYQPRTVKMQITGSGRAEKEVVRQFLYQQLKMKPTKQSMDATDALALAFCHVLKDSVRAKTSGVRVR